MAIAHPGLSVLLRRTSTSSRSSAPVGPFSMTSSSTASMPVSTLLRFSGRLSAHTMPCVSSDPNRSVALDTSYERLSPYLSRDRPCRCSTRSSAANRRQWHESRRRHPPPVRQVDRRRGIHRSAHAEDGILRGEPLIGPGLHTV